MWFCAPLYELHILQNTPAKHNASCQDLYVLLATSPNIHQSLLDSQRLLTALSIAQTILYNHYFIGLPQLTFAALPAVFQIPPSSFISTSVPSASIQPPTTYTSLAISAPSPESYNLCQQPCIFEEGDSMGGGFDRRGFERRGFERRGFERRSMFDCIRKEPWLRVWKFRNVEGDPAKSVLIIALQGN